MTEEGSRPSENDVLAFLKKDPGFLERHPELLKALVGEAGGEADNVLSISERLLKKALREQEALKNRLKALMAAARERERLEGKLEELERIIFTSRSLPSMLTRVASETKRLFELDEVCISLKQELNESLRDLFEDKAGPVIGVKKKLLDDLLPDDEPALRGNLEGGSLPFFRKGGELRSEAILPLRVGGELLGSLNLGSRSPERYHPDLGVHILKRLALHLSRGIESLREMERLRREAAFDAETGAISAGRLKEVLSSEFYRAERYNHPLSLILIRFEGEAEGCLIEGARLLKQRTRESDIVIRRQEPGLVILLPMTPLDGGAAASRRFSSMVADEVLRREKLDETKLQFSFSAFPEGGAKSPDEFLSQAEKFILPGGGLLGGPGALFPQ